MTLLYHPNKYKNEMNTNVTIYTKTINTKNLFLLSYVMSYNKYIRATTSQQLLTGVIHQLYDETLKKQWLIIPTFCFKNNSFGVNNMCQIKFADLVHRQNCRAYN